MVRFRELWSRISNSEFSRNVSIQILGTGLAQMLPFLATPLLTRIFAEEDFAIYTSFFAVATIFGVGVGGKYHLAIVLPKEEKDAKRIFWLSLYITVAYAMLVLLLMPLLWDFFPIQSKKILFCIPVYVLFFGIWSAYINVSIRHKKFKDNAIAKVLQSVAYILTAIGMGLSKLTFIGLVIAKIAGTLVSGFFLSKKSLYDPSFTKPSILLPMAKKYIDYPKFGIWPALLNTVSLQGPVLILTKGYSSTDLGHYGLTYMVLSAPLALIGASYKDVFYEKIASLIKQNKVKQSLGFFKKSSWALFFMGLPVCLVLYFFGQEIFAFIFGSQWQRSGEFAAILAFGFLIRLVVSPLSSIFNATNTLKIASRWQVLYFLTTFGVLGYCAFILKLEVSVLLMIYVIHDLVLYGLYYLLQFRTLKTFWDR